MALRYAIKALFNPKIIGLWFRRKLTLMELFSLDEYSYDLLKDLKVRNLIGNRRIQVKSLIKLNWRVYNALKDPFVLKQIEDKNLNIDEVRSISEAAFKCFKCENVKELLGSGFFTAKDVLGFRDLAFEAFNNENVIQLIKDKRIQFNQVLGINKWGISILSSVYGLLISNILTVEQWLTSNNITTGKVNILNDPMVNSWIRGGIIASQQVLDLSDEQLKKLQRRLLNDKYYPDRINFILLNNALTFNQLVNMEDSDFSKLVTKRTEEGLVMKAKEVLLSTQDQCSYIYHLPEDLIVMIIGHLYVDCQADILEIESPEEAMKFRQKCAHEIFTKARNLIESQPQSDPDAGVENRFSP